MKNHKKGFFFFVFSESLLALNQLFKEFLSHYHYTNIHVSSAYNIFKIRAQTLQISLTDKLKSRGPRIDPCGTLHLTS